MKRIDEQRRGIRPVVGVGEAAHQEVAREVHALDGEAGAAGDVDEDQRERDGNARAPGEHVVEQRVARVVVLVVVAGESQLAVDELGDDPQAHAPRRGAAEADLEMVAGRGAHLLELPQKRGRVQVRIGDPCHQQSAAGQVVVGTGCLAHELVDQPRSHRGTCDVSARALSTSASSTSSETCEISGRMRSASMSVPAG